MLECYTLLIIGSIPRNIDCPIDSERDGMRFDDRQFIIERRLLELMYLDGRASPCRMQRVAQIVNASYKKAVDNRFDQAASSANPQRCINRSYDAGTVVDVDNASSAQQRFTQSSASIRRIWRCPYYEPRTVARTRRFIKRVRRCAVFASAKREAY